MDRAADARAPGGEGGGDPSSGRPTGAAAALAALAAASRARMAPTAHAAPWALLTALLVKPTAPGMVQGFGRGGAKECKRCPGGTKNSRGEGEGG